MNYTFNEGDNVTITAEFIDYLGNLKKEKQQLKEIIEYLERSNNRREETIINLRDELVGQETVLDEIRKYIEDNKDTCYTDDDINYLLNILDKVKNNDS